MLPRAVQLDYRPGTFRALKRTLLCHHPKRKQRKCMPTPESMRETVLRYLQLVGEQDLEAVLALFADSISVEDPVGGPTGTHVVGLDAVSNFFKKGFARTRPSPTLTGPVVTTGGNEVAVPFTLRLELMGKHHELDVVDVIQFDDRGQIISLRAFWNYDERREDPNQDDLVS